MPKKLTRKGAKKGCSHLWCGLGQSEAMAQSTPQVYTTIILPSLPPCTRCRASHAARAARAGRRAAAPDPGGGRAVARPRPPGGSGGCKNSESFGGVLSFACSVVDLFICLFVTPVVHFFIFSCVRSMWGSPKWGHTPAQVEGSTSEGRPSLTPPRAAARARPGRRADRAGRPAWSIRMLRAPYGHFRN